MTEHTWTIRSIYEDIGLSGYQTTLVFIAIGIGLCLCVLARLYNDRVFELPPRYNKYVVPEYKSLGFSLALRPLLLD